MAERILLQIGGQRIENFQSYSLEADIYTADDAFSLDLANPEITVRKGQRCIITVNAQIELTGIIDRVVKNYNKAGVTLKVEGRDLCGLLVDSYCTEFFDVQSLTLKSLAERLLKNVPYIKRSDISYDENFRGNLKRKPTETGVLATPQTFAKVEPGQTIFDVLKTYAMSRGAMFFTLPDGTFVFGRPKAGGNPLWHLINRKSDPSQNNVLEGSLDDNIARRYSEVRVMGQPQGTNTQGDPMVNTKAVVPDPTFPFYKPYIASDNNDSRGPALHGRMLIEKMKFDGFKIQYKVPGHGQNGINYRINEMCRVTDEVLGLDDNYLVYGRTFEMSTRGVFTTLKLGYPGVVQ